VIFHWSTDPTISTPVFPHNYQDNFYNMVRSAQVLLDGNVRAHSTRRANRVNPRDLEGEGKLLKKRKSAFWRNGEVTVQDLCD